MLRKNQVVKVQYNSKEIEVIVINVIYHYTSKNRFVDWTTIDYLVFDSKTLYILNEYVYTERDNFTKEVITTDTIAITKKLTTLKELNSVKL